MRVIVTGLVATYPVAGVAYDYLQYVQGFRALGCDVHYLEDTGQWFYDPLAGTFTPDAGSGARFLAAALSQLCPEGEQAWAIRGNDGALLGPDAVGFDDLCARTDLFLNVSGGCWLRELYRRAKVTAYVDTDPGYSQAKLLAAAAGATDPELRRSVDLIRSHQCFFTLAERIGQADCGVPVAGIVWHPTRPPIVLANWPNVPSPVGAPFTTIMSWKIEPAPPVVEGRQYGGKDVEIERFLGLPARVAVPLEVAISGDAPRARLAAAGWRVVEARGVSDTLESYRGYLAASRGEFSVAKNVYVAMRSGWFSTRSAAYLASGRPVVIQDTGFSSYLPVGPGLRPFTTIEEAATALTETAADPISASRHAHTIAAECFDARTICTQLLHDAGF